VAARNSIRLRSGRPGTGGHQALMVDQTIPPTRSQRISVKVTPGGRPICKVWTPLERRLDTRQSIFLESANRKIESHLSF
jgi:hypothetical protein